MEKLVCYCFYREEAYGGNGVESDWPRPQDGMYATIYLKDSERAGKPSP